MISNKRVVLAIVLSVVGGFLLGFGFMALVAWIGVLKATAELSFITSFIFL